MKKLFYLLLMLPLFFVACSDDDDDQDSFEGNIDPTTVFKAGQMKRIGSYEFAYDANKLLTSVTPDGGKFKMTLAYDKKYTKAENNYPKDVVMTLENEGEPTRTYYIKLGSNGFVSHAVYVFTDKGEDGKDVVKELKINFLYNADKQVARMTEDAGKEGRLVTVFRYSNGNLVTIGEDHSMNKNATRTKNMKYSSEGIKEGIENVGGLAWFEIADSNIEFLDYLFYAGLLGQPSKQLPLVVIEKDRELVNGEPVEKVVTTDLTWTVGTGEDKRATKVETKVDGVSGLGFTFEWTPFEKK